MAIDDPRLVALVEAGLASLDADTLDLRIPRVIPIAILVDAAQESKSIGEYVRLELQAVLTRNGYSSILEWGPFEGSYFLATFATSNRPQDGRTFAQKMKSIHAELIQRVSSFPWGEAWKIGEAGVKVAVSVGTIAMVLTAAEVAPAAAPFMFPVVVWKTLQVLKEAADIVESVKSVFFNNKKSEEILKNEDEVTKKQEGWSTVVDHDIVIRRPLTFKARI